MLLGLVSPAVLAGTRCGLGYAGMRRDETGANARQERRGMLMLTLSQFSLARHIFLSLPPCRCSEVRPHRIRYTHQLHLAARLHFTHHNIHPPAMPFPKLVAHISAMLYFRRVANPMAYLHGLQRSDRNVTTTIMHRPHHQEHVDCSTWVSLSSFSCSHTHQQ